jgi:hypothetical protein
MPDDGTFDVWSDPPMVQPKKRWWRRFRSADTGEFVTEEQAAANPDTTVGEKVVKFPPPPPVR